MEYVFLGIFFLASAIHLYARIKRKARIRDISKVCILLPLILVYVFGAKNINVFVVIALICCWIGDILLLMHGFKWFALGGCSFLAGHVFFIIAYHASINYQEIPIWLLIIIPIMYIVSICIVLIKLKPYIKKALFIPTCGYLMANGAMNIFAVYRLITNISLSINTNSLLFIGPLLTSVGALLFLISDSSLFFVRFNKNSVMKTHFLVMLTYSLGELLIVLGLMI